MSREICETREWFIFGTTSNGKFNEIADSDNDTVLRNIPIEIAQQICDAHNDAIEDCRKQHRE